MSCVICARISTVRLTKNGRTGLHSVALPRYFRYRSGTSYLFKEKFDTPNGLAQFFTCDWVAPIDKLTDEYPMVLSTVREVGHYSCRSMTGNCAALAALADEHGYAQINTEDAKRLGIEDEALVWVHSRKGKIITRAQVSDRPNKGRFT